MRKLLPMLVFALCGLAFAQAAGGDSSLIGNIVGVVLAALLATLTAVGASLIGKAHSFVAGLISHVKIKGLENALSVVDEVVYAKVTQLYQEATVKLKAAASDGELTPNEAKAIFATALTEAWTALPDIIKTILIDLAGGEGQAKQSYLAPAVEKAYQSVKEYAPPKPKTPPDPSKVAAAAAAARTRVHLTN